jgi:hypothetical protein
MKRYRLWIRKDWVERATSRVEHEQLESMLVLVASCSAREVQGFARDYSARLEMVLASSLVLTKPVNVLYATC